MRDLRRATLHGTNDDRGWLEQGRQVLQCVAWMVTLAMILSPAIMVLGVLPATRQAVFGSDPRPGLLEVAYLVYSLIGATAGVGFVTGRRWGPAAAAAWCWGLALPTLLYSSAPPLTRLEGCVGPLCCGASFVGLEVLRRAVRRVHVGTSP